MSAVALSLVLASALIHAAWNALIKQARLHARGPHTGPSRRSLVFVWLMVLFSIPWFAPVLAIQWPSLAVPPAGWLCLAGTALLHFLYYVLLALGYAAGELSVVYPVARGVGPALVALGGILALREPVSLPGLAGIAAIIAGVVGLSHLSGRLAARRHARDGRGLAYGMGIGLTVAGYSLVDKVGVGDVGVAPEVYMLLAHVGAGLVLTPVVLATCGADQCRRAMRRSWARPVLAGGLCVVGYLLVLHAFRMANASYVVPARSCSILFAVLLGGRFLGERRVGGKLLAACAIVGGIWLIAVRG